MIQTSFLRIALTSPFSLSPLPSASLSALPAANQPQLDPRMPCMSFWCSASSFDDAPSRSGLDASRVLQPLLPHLVSVRAHGRCKLHWRQQAHR